MGLDTYAVLPLPLRQEGGTDCYDLAPNEAFKEVPPALCGGMFSGHGNGPSFRGGVYADYVERVTGVSLYAEYIPPCTVKRMAEALEGATPEFEDDVTEEEAHALALWFKVCADNGYAIVGWW